MQNRFEKINREVERDLHEFFCDLCNLTKNRKNENENRFEGGEKVKLKFATNSPWIEIEKEPR